MMIYVPASRIFHRDRVRSGPGDAPMSTTAEERSAFARRRSWHRLVRSANHGPLHLGTWSRKQRERRGSRRSLIADTRFSRFVVPRPPASWQLDNDEGHADPYSLKASTHN